MSGSCHLDKVLNVEIGVECQMKLCSPIRWSSLGILTGETLWLQTFLRNLTLPSAPLSKFRPEKFMNYKESPIGALCFILLHFMFNISGQNISVNQMATEFFKNSDHNYNQNKNYLGGAIRSGSEPPRSLETIRPDSKALIRSSLGPKASTQRPAWSSKIPSFVA